MFGEGLSGPGPRRVGIYELKGVLDAPKISFIMCSHLLSEEVGGRSFIYTSLTTLFFVVHLLAIDCLSFNLTHFIFFTPLQDLRIYF